MDATYPKIKEVKPLEGYMLLVTFRNGITKIYDCSALLALPTFFLLQDKAFFRAVQADRGGYGIFWNDELDLSESELWLNGQVVEAAEATET
jgi:hypothetical protein